MTIIDRGCWERGCACYDSRIADEIVEVAPRNDVLEEVARAVHDFKAFEKDTMDSFAAFIRGMKK